MLGLKTDSCFPVVVDPVGMRQSAFFFPFRINRRSRQWSQDAWSNSVNAQFFASPQRFPENVSMIRVKSENDPGPDGNAVFMYQFDYRFISGHIVTLFIHTSQTVGGEGFKSDKQIKTARLFGRLEQFLIFASVDSDLSRPSLFQTFEFLHQLLGVINISKKVVVPEDKISLSNGLDVFNYFMNGSHSERRAINLFKIAVAAVVRAASCGKDGSFCELPSLYQISSGNGRSL